ncbi:MAG: hypothetical protein KY428_10940, partial [Bacteroidetes bacterium]|nr:hypothetical protein [Bacteroidota bacterium]
MRDLKFINLVKETLNNIILSEAKTPAEQAHDLGLIHTGYGYWANDAGKVVARTIDGVLTKYEKEEEIPDYADTEEEEDLTRKEIKEKGEAALDKIANYAYDLLGLNPDDHKFIPLTIIHAIRFKEVPDWTAAYDDLEEDELVDFKSFLAGIANSNTKLIRQAGMLIKQLNYTGKKPKYNDSSTDDFNAQMHKAMGFDFQDEPDV